MANLSESGREKKHLKFSASTPEWRDLSQTDVFHFLI